MSNLEEFLNNKLPEDQDDLFMKKITKLRMDGMKMDYAQKLEKTYGVSKKKNRTAKIRRISAIVLSAAAVAVLAFVFLNPQLIKPHQLDYVDNITSYVDKNKIHNYDVVRDESNQSAYALYQEGKYAEAIEILENEEIDLQDSFYLAMSQFYNGNYDKAEESFSAFSNILGVGEKFYPESQLYHVLTLHLLKKDDRAKEIYESWPKDSWMSMEYRKIIKD